MLIMMTTMMLMIIITNRKKGKDDFKATLGYYLSFMTIKMAGTRATGHIIPIVKGRQNECIHAAKAQPGCSTSSLIQPRNSYLGNGATHSR